MDRLSGSSTPLRQTVALPLGVARTTAIRFETHDSTGVACMNSDIRAANQILDEYILH